VSTASAPGEHRANREAAAVVRCPVSGKLWDAGRDAVPGDLVLVLVVEGVALHVALAAAASSTVNRSEAGR
jgi:hypothetical protein